MPTPARTTKLDLDPATVKHARSLARKAGRPIVTMAKKHTTVAVERATLRLAGLSGADDEGSPWVNRLMDTVRADLHDVGGLEHGVSLPVWDALVRGEAADLTTLAQKAAAGSVSFRLPEGKDADRARAARKLSGVGITVGVLSDGVDSLPASIASGDLPADVRVLAPGYGDEGTAMLEIVHDEDGSIAKLYFATYAVTRRPLAFADLVD